MADKVNEISDTMTRNGVYGKQIWVTETVMWVNLQGSGERQRDFIVREFTRGLGAERTTYSGSICGSMT